MGRAAYGVKGITLEKDDEVVGVEVVEAGGTVLTLTSNGYGKRTAIEEYPLQSRGGKGTIDIKTTDRNGPVVGVKFLRGDEQVMLITEKGMIIRLNTADISTIGRNTQGVRLIQLEEGDHLVSVARLAEREEGDEGGGPPRPDAAARGQGGGMIKRGGVALAAVVALAGVACGHPEKSVVDQYFNAVNAKDTQTLSSFAAVTFDKKVDQWAIKKTISEEKKPAPLPELAQKAKDADSRRGRQHEGRPHLVARSLQRHRRRARGAQGQQAGPGQAGRRRHQVGRLQQQGPRPQEEPWP